MYRSKRTKPATNAEKPTQYTSLVKNPSSSSQVNDLIISSADRQPINDVQIEVIHIENLDVENEESSEAEDGSTSNSSKKMIWKEIPELKDKDVEIIDAQNRIELRKGVITPPLVWTLEEGKKFVVNFNEFKQPIEKGGHILIRFLGDIAKKGDLCPIGEINWHKVQKSYKFEIVRIVRMKFHIPTDEDINDRILSNVGAKWRSYKYKLKKLFFNPKKTQIQNETAVPKDVIKEQWIRLVAYWHSTKSKELSQIGKRSRGDKDDIHTTGSKSYAQKRIEYVQEHEKEPSSLEFWEATHLRKDGSYVEKTSTKEFMDTAKQMVDENLANSSEKSKTQVEEEVFNELMYDKDKPNQRLVGYGYGVSRSQVFGLKADLRRSSNIHDSSTSIDDVKKELELVKEENVQLKKTCVTLTSNLSLITQVLAKHGIEINFQNGMDNGQDIDNTQMG